jgi:hypothetical protein
MVAPSPPPNIGKANKGGVSGSGGSHHARTLGRRMLWGAWPSPDVSSITLAQGAPWTPSRLGQECLERQEQPPPDHQWSSAARWLLTSRLGFFSETTARPLPGFRGIEPAPGSSGQ